MKRILIVDDDRRTRRTLQIMMERLGFDSVAASTGRSAVDRVRNEKFDLVLTDLKMPEMNGIDLVTKVHALDSGMPVVVMTAYGTIRTAIDAMRNGAFDYILKPFDNEALALIIEKAFDLQRYRSENRFLKEEIDSAWGKEHPLPTLPGMRAVAAVMEKVAPTGSPILITGETGTGKELVARSIHGLSPRRNNLFVPLNCAAMPPELLESELFGHVRGAFTGAHHDRQGKFEVANGGTLFLDEIGDTPLPLQAKLLRVMEDGVIEPVGGNKRFPVDVRIISATNQDLDAAMEAKRFRSDLYYRINTFQLHLAPLRERPDDIPILAESFLGKFARDLGKPAVQLAADATGLLQAYRWPGNVRELRNFMERIVVLAPVRTVHASDLRSFMPPSMADGPQTPDERPAGVAVSTDPVRGLPLHEAVEQFERRMILRGLDESADNKAEAARRLGISERNLWYKLNKYGL